MHRLNPKKESGAGGNNAWKVAAFVTVVLLLVALGESFASRGTTGQRLLVLGLVVGLGTGIVGSWRASDPAAVLVGLYVGGRHIIGWTLPSPSGWLSAAQAVFLALLGLAAYRGTIPDNDRRSILSYGSTWLLVVPWGISSAAAVVLRDETLATARFLDLAAVIVTLVVLTRRNPQSGISGLAIGFCSLLIVLVLAGGSSIGAERFGGGALANVHPNILGFLAWLPMAYFFWTISKSWLLRGPATASLLVLLYMSDSRTAAAAGLMALLLLLASATLRRLHLLKGSRIARGLTVMIVAGVIAVLVAFGSGFFLRTRGPVTDTLTGREAIWASIVDDWSSAGWMEKLTGTASNTVGTISVPSSGSSQPFTAHSAFFGLLRRTGVLGLAAGLAGMLTLGIRALVGVSSSEKAGPAAIVLAGLATGITEVLLVGLTLYPWMLTAEGILLSDSGTRPARSKPDDARPAGFTPDEG